jgi:hypothetical protein
LSIKERGKRERNVKEQNLYGLSPSFEKQTKLKLPFSSPPCPFFRRAASLLTDWVFQLFSRWNEQFIYRLEFDHYGLVARYEVWADPLSAFFASQE